MSKHGPERVQAELWRIFEEVRSRDLGEDEAEGQTAIVDAITRTHEAEAISGELRSKEAPSFEKEKKS